MTASLRESRSEAAERSRAFREASLRSEEHRAYAVLLVIAIIVVPILLLRTVNALEVQLRIVGVLAAFLLLAIQLCSIMFIRWSRRHDRHLPGWLAVIGVTIECSVPTGIILAHTLLGTMQPYAALSSPPLLAYCVLISLTTLRLRPGLCLWAGTAATAGYAGVFMYVALGMNVNPPESGWPAPGYVMAILLIFASGVTAAWVAREIRSHVEAALDEAEMHRKMERVEYDLSVARVIQQSLLPRDSPTIPGYDIAAWNRPADQTGGDYYDWQMLPDGNWMVTVADVSGHGIGPALVTAACRAYVRASSSHFPDLASLATRVNRLLADDLPEGRFVTMVNVLLNPGGGPLAILSAGHGPIVLYCGSTGEMKSINPHGIPLAITPDLDIEPAQSIELAPGDILALITDGFVEWAKPNRDGRREEFGLERLRDSLMRHANLPARALIDAVAADVAAFAGGVPQQDDLTMVVIRRSG